MARICTQWCQVRAPSLDKGPRWEYLSPSPLDSCLSTLCWILFSCFCLPLNPMLDFVWLFLFCLLIRCWILFDCFCLPLDPMLGFVDCFCLPINPLFCFCFNVLNSDSLLASPSIISLILFDLILSFSSTSLYYVWLLNIPIVSIRMHLCTVCMLRCIVHVYGLELLWLCTDVQDKHRERKVQSSIINLCRDYLGNPSRYQSGLQDLFAPHMIWVRSSSRT